MHQQSTAQGPQRLTGTPALGARWEVKVQAQGTAYVDTWTIEAKTTDQASRQAVELARRAWPGFGLVVRSVVQVA
ncbi:hypothetical protein [Roseateles violae]|uniref:Uncharacterized protein n=1 Tax=Roseateles violae TaxID=3058042 RepID=A0ABT8DT90_9BURK|nr:hypothetical protein [Pelomonas sp. PFR6]MDN3921522.1 hypothetical protein [Pelomonas sp. PFR6]